MLIENLIEIKEYKLRYEDDFANYIQSLISLVKSGSRTSTLKSIEEQIERMELFGSISPQRASVLREILQN